MPKDDINYRFTENGVVYDFYDVFVPGDYFREPSLFTWGLNNVEQLGINSGTDNRLTPVTTFAGGTNWKSVGATYQHAAAIKTDGTLWVWGDNSQGSLGTNDTTNRNTPVTTFAGGTNWKQVSSGYMQSTLAIKTDGTLWVWGDNAHGQLGTNDTNDRTTPVTTFAGGNNWKSVGGGDRYTIALKTDGTLWAWGRNAYGQLGTNDTNGRTTPVTTFAGGTNWKTISTQFHHNLAAIKTDGTLWTCGYGVFGQLGINENFPDRLTPVTTFAGGTNWKSVHSSFGNIVAIKTDGTLWLWGIGGLGGLGTNDTTERKTPVTTFAGGTNWKQVSMKRYAVAATKTDGTLWTWGYNSNGQLGINNLTDRSTPVTTFAGGNNWKQVECNYFGTIAIKYTPDP